MFALAQVISIKDQTLRSIVKLHDMKLWIERVRNDKSGKYGNFATVVLRVQEKSKCTIKKAYCQTKKALPMEVYEELGSWNLDCGSH